MVLGNCIEVRKFSLYYLTTNHMGFLDMIYFEATEV